MAQAIALTEAQTRVAVRGPSYRKLDSLVVHNPSTNARVFLNVWDDIATSGSPALAIANVMDQIPIGPGLSAVIFIDRLISGSLVLSASTAADGTGAPAGAVDVGGLRWISG